MATVPDGYVLEILYDEDYVPEGDDGIEEEETQKIGTGEWEPYAVALHKVCECCRHISERYVDALWGCVVESCNAENTYTDTSQIPNSHLADVALDLISGVTKA